MGDAGWELNVILFYFFSFSKEIKWRVRTVEVKIKMNELPWCLKGYLFEILNAYIMTVGL